MRMRILASSGIFEGRCEPFGLEILSLLSDLVGFFALGLLGIIFGEGSKHEMEWPASHVGVRGGFGVSFVVGFGLSNNVVGMILGWAVGVPVGFSVGTVDRTSDEVGMILGWTVGFPVGVPVGFSVGTVDRTGDEVAVILGWAVGLPVGVPVEFSVLVGMVLGWAVGLSVGVPVGFSVGMVDGASNVAWVSRGIVSGSPRRIISIRWDVYLGGPWDCQWESLSDSQLEQLMELVTWLGWYLGGVGM